MSAPEPLIECYSCTTVYNPARPRCPVCDWPTKDSVGYEIAPNSMFHAGCAWPMAYLLGAVALAVLAVAYALWPS